MSRKVDFSRLRNRKLQSTLSVKKEALVLDELKAKAGDIVQKVTVHQSKDNVADGIRVERYEEGKEWVTRNGFICRSDC